MSELNITYTYRCGEKVELEKSPDQIVVHASRGVSINGDWKLKVSDHAGADQGKLNRWALQLRPM